jgi:hypothetical protein
MSPDFTGDDDGPPGPVPYADLSDPQSLTTELFAGGSDRLCASASAEHGDSELKVLGKVQVSSSEHLA